MLALCDDTSIISLRTVPFPPTLPANITERGTKKRAEREEGFERSVAWRLEGRRARGAQGIGLWVPR